MFKTLCSIAIAAALATFVAAAVDPTVNPTDMTFNPTISSTTETASGMKVPIYPPPPHKPGEVYIMDAEEPVAATTGRLPEVDEVNDGEQEAAKWGYGYGGYYYPWWYSRYYRGYGRYWW